MKQRKAVAIDDRQEAKDGLVALKGGDQVAF